MKTKTKANEVKPKNVWWCETCQSRQMTHAKIIEHLKSKHGLETKGMKCQKRMLMHLDGDTWFTSRYEVKIECGNGEILTI